MKSKKYWGILLKVFFVIVALEINLQILASTSTLMYQDAGNQSSAYKILVLGDSTTAGTYNSWPAQLENVLNNQSPVIEFKVFNEGIPNSNTLYILGKLKGNIEKYKPDMIIIMAGSNDEFNINRYMYKEDNILIDLLGRSQIFRKTEILTELMKRYFYKNPGSNAQKSESSWQIENLTEQNLDYAFSLGYYYMDKNITASEKIFREIIKRYPENDKAYVGLGVTYINMGKSGAAEASLLKGAKINPSNDRAYGELGHLYSMTGSMEKAVSMYKKAIELNNKTPDYYLGLGSIYYTEKRSNDAKEMLEKTLLLDPGNDHAYAVLGWIYRDLGDESKAKESLKKALSINPDRTEAAITLMYMDEKIDNEDFRKYFGVSITASNISAYDILRYHYKQIYSMAKKYNVKFVVMQYPTLSIKALSDFFTEEEQEDIIFVENEENFKEAIEKGGYEDYFTDEVGLSRLKDSPFFGKYGHATIKGNMLIAENAADSITNYLNITAG